MCVLTSDKGYVPKCAPGSTDNKITADKERVFVQNTNGFVGSSCATLPTVVNRA